MQGVRLGFDFDQHILLFGFVVFQSHCPEGNFPILSSIHSPSVFMMSAFSATGKNL